MSLRIVSKLEQVEPCSFDRFLTALGHAEPVPAGLPQSLLCQMAARPFAYFDNVLTMQPPASKDMVARVARMRAADQQARSDLPLATDGQSTGERRLMMAIGVTVTVFCAWIVIGVALAYLAGRL